jgi:16S rRNA G966 N2-methylase RsmD
MLDFLESQGLLEEFLKRRVKPYDPAADDYDRPPFAADIKEGKNDSIYNAHSYHTKVPPRSIIPYILHYTKPDDLVLDLFCGSGMTGVAAQMCAAPPGDILEQFPELKDRVGPRACILNDLSPAACHIAYNYNTPVDVNALKKEFERIKAAIKDEFDWLYGTEHYEPAIGDYAISNPEVLTRLKNPPPESQKDPTQPSSLLEEDAEVPKTWTLLSRSDVEQRLGYPVSDLSRDQTWKDLDVSQVEEWICIPATIQYTIWSDVYRCEGFITTEEFTGKVSKRGKNVGKPIVSKKRVVRGCGQEFALYDVAMDKETTKVFKQFQCPECHQEWAVDKLTLVRADPAEVVYQFLGRRVRSDGSLMHSKVRRKLSMCDREKVQGICQRELPYWYPKTLLVPGEQGNPFIKRGLVSVDQLYTARNLFASARLWREFDSVSDTRVRKALQFLFTAVSARNLTRMTRYRQRGNEALAMRLFIPHFQAEMNPLKVLAGKYDDITSYFSTNSFFAGSVLVTTGPAQEITWLSDSSIDFIFADPPFGRNIAYAELNVLWEAWLGRTTDVPKEAITSNGRKWGVESYTEKMRNAFKEMFRVLKPGRYAMIEFNNGDPELGLFEHIKQAALDAGFQITNMMILDKEHKSFNQMVGVMRGEDTVDKDVVFNLHKPAVAPNQLSAEDHDLGQQVADTVRQHLQTLPERIKAEPAKYSDDHRTTATINSMLMNTLIPRGVSVERLNLPYIERVCSRYFRKIGQHWYLRGEAVTNGNSGGLIREEIAVKDEVSAIEWLRQKVQMHPLLVGELKPLWMRATGLLAVEVSQQLDLEVLLRENFWKDAESNRWREPTEAERDLMNDSQTLRVLHDAERFLAGSLKRQVSDTDRCEWIEAIFRACRAVEEQEGEELPALRDFDPGAGYRMIIQLFHGVLSDHVPATVFVRAEKQAHVASSRLREGIESDKTGKKARESKNQLELEL